MIKTRIVHIGDIPLGGDYPVRLQSMTNTSTLDTKATVAQAVKIIDAGADYVRIATPSIKDARNLANIKKELLELGYDNPIIADIHFNPKVAEVAAKIADKIRINPGNFVDNRKKGLNIISDEGYENELNRIREKFVPIIKVCKEHRTVIRVGVNHGSLSERILFRYGDTPEGMVESAIEYLRICREIDFNDVVVSMKSSNTKLMIYASRLLVKRMIEESMNYPQHLGVTEAGEGEDGRIRSAVGIGTLLSDGIGDTIRVSLTEEPENELPVAKLILSNINNGVKYINSKRNLLNLNTLFEKRSVDRINVTGSNNYPVVIGKDITSVQFSKEILLTYKGQELNDKDVERVRTGKGVILFEKGDYLHLTRFLDQNKLKIPVVIKSRIEVNEPEVFQIVSAVAVGKYFIDSNCDGIWLESTGTLDPEIINETALRILQATGSRYTRPEYISCPTCSRTGFDIQKAVQEIKARTEGRKGVKIAIMGCIVNGPGEMADADFGYVGSGKGLVTIYKGKEIVQKNIPEEKAVDILIDIIKNTD